MDFTEVKSPSNNHRLSLRENIFGSLFPFASKFQQIQGDIGCGKRYGLPASLAQWFVVQVADDFGDRPWLSGSVDTALLAEVATHRATLETALLGRL